MYYIYFHFYQNIPTFTISKFNPNFNPIFFWMVGGDFLIEKVFRISFMCIYKNKGALLESQTHIFTSLIS